MKVLHIITGLGSGGAESSLFRLIVGDRENVHEVVSLTGRGVYGERLYRRGIRVDALDMPRGWITVSGIIQLVRALRSFRPDVVQTWMYHADLLGGVFAWAFGTGFIVWGVRGPFDRKRTSWRTRVAVRCCAVLSHVIPGKIVCNSLYAAQIHLRIGYDGRKLVTIPNGYSLAEYRPHQGARRRLFRELQLETNTILIGMVARYDQHKDHANLLTALSLIGRRLPKITCLLVGEGISRSNASLMQLISAHGVEGLVMLLELRNDVPEIMTALDLHVLSSAAESFPNVLAEAMACGTPCVTTDVGDAALIVGDTGWVVSRSNSEALADALVLAVEEMNDPIKANARREACRKRICENYSLERMISSYIQVWKGTAVSH